MSQGTRRPITKPHLGGRGAGVVQVQGQHRGGFSRLPVMSQNATLLSLFSSLTLFLAFAVHLAALAGPEADLAVWVFLRVVKIR